MISRRRFIGVFFHGTRRTSRSWSTAFGGSLGAFSSFSSIASWSAWTSTWTTWLRMRSRYRTQLGLAIAFPSVWCEQVFLDCKSGQNEGPASHDHPVMLPELITVVLTLPATAISPCPALES